MRVVLAMVVRDEVDIVEQHLRFHLAAGVDIVLATDHGSRDGTREILEEHEAQGSVVLFREGGEYNRQGEWMTRMVRFAAAELGADWVLCSDGDEFWWPHGGSVEHVLASVPERYGTLHVLSQSFLPLPDDDRCFAERMTLRLSPAAPINDPAGPYRPVAKIACRAHEHAVVSNGNHEVRGVTGASLRGWVPLEILHFPLRSAAQTVRKYRKTWLAWEENLRGDLARARSLAEGGREESFYERIVLRGPSLSHGLETGSLVRDTRLRDALRGIREPHGDARADTSHPWAKARNDRHPVEVAVLAEAEIVRLHRRADALRARADRLGRGRLAC